MNSMNNYLYKGIIFDLDGTLADTLEDLIDSCNAMLSDFGFPTHDYETGKTFIGNGIRKLVERALPEKERNNDTLIDAAFQRMNTEYARRYADKTQPYQGIHTVLSRLDERHIPYAINTNKPDEMAKAVVAACFKNAHFQMICGKKDGIPHKPDPAQALKIASQLNLSPRDCLYIGDSPVDHDTAVNAGMASVLCTWGFTKKEKLLQYKDAVIIDHPTDIIQLIFE